MKKMILATLVALVMLSGVASAYNAAIWNEAGTDTAPNPLYLKPGDSLTLSYHVQNLAPNAVGVEIDYDYTVVALSPGAQVSDITVTLPATFTPADVIDTDVGVINIALDGAAPVGEEYRVTIKAGDELVDIDFGSASRNVTSIPEFPTVALPVAAILGLAFFMQRRKEE